MKKILFVPFFLLTALAYPQSAQLTPVNDTGTHIVTVTVPAKYSSAFSAGRKLEVQSKYTVSLYHAGGLNKPRFMAFSPKGILHVSDMNAGKVFALPDANGDGVADTMTEAATGFSGNHDVKFYKGAMYVTEPTRIWKCTDTNADGIYETKTIFISGINNNAGGHTTRTVVFDSINKKVYVSIGSSCNVCRETNDRAMIKEYNEDGTGGRVFATGVRNAVGMAMHPITNRLWANNNGSDNQGNETPPEWIDIVRDKGFYGHPFAYGSGVWFNFTGSYQSLLPITAADSAKVAKLVHPAALIRAHSAPMALQFLNMKFNDSMQHGFLTALRGSWNTTNPRDFRGYKVIYGHLSSPQDTTVDYVSDFCSGFITDTVNRVFWGRPVGIAIDNDGKVYISSDEGNRVILVMTPDNDETGKFTYTSRCINEQTKFLLLDSLGNDSVKWIFGDTASGANNFSSKVRDIQHVYSQYGNYTVQLITYNNSISDTSIAIVTFLNPEPDFLASDVCENDSVRFFDKSSVSAGKLDINWKFGDGQNSNLRSPSHFYKIDGISKTFNVTLVTVMLNGCADSIIKSVTVNAKPVSDFNFTANQNTVDFTMVQSGNISYKWYLGNGDSASTKDLSYTYSKSGNYTVCLKVTNAAQCFSQTCKNIAVTAGISDFERDFGFKIYPNPNEGKFEIEIANPSKSVTVEIFNAVGMRIPSSIDLKNGGSKYYALNLELSSGIYLLKIQNEGKVYFQKMVVTAK